MVKSFLKNYSYWDDVCLANSISEKLGDILKSNCSDRRRLSVTEDSDCHTACNVLILFHKKAVGELSTSVAGFSIFFSTKGVGMPLIGSP